jgi:glycyl-tRNA synthetase
MKSDKKEIITFQEIIERLNAFWSSKGCIIGQPYGVEVGAGTGNPHTFLRSLGPEFFNVAYVEPSRRPDDGRYGQNPYRLQHYFQYQIILKPAPENNQELFLESLKVLGIDIHKHDIRFVEDNWESPAIGAWGLGWEVWLDGMEITQYTYFQQVAGIPLEVPTLEITLGLERLAMYIQGFDDYRDIMWNKDVKYGDLFEKHEYWQSKHNYETANVKDLTSIYNLMEKQIGEQLEVGNYWVAYDYLLKISHIFNILDSRGVVSVTDRIGKFKKMGAFSRDIGKLYLKEREEMNYPLKNIVKPVEYTLSKKPCSTKTTVTNDNKLILELYFEEMPSDFLRQWEAEYYKAVDIKKIMKEAGFNFKDLRMYWGPRRLVLDINGCSDEGIVMNEIVGPLYDIAFTKGKLNKVGFGFLKKHGLKQKDVFKMEKGGKTLLGAKVQKKITLENLLESILEKLFAISPNWKSMKWSADQNQTFLRPLRNILCFKDGKKIDISYMGVKSTEYTFCTRYFDKNIIGICSASDYIKTMRNLDIIIDQTYREGVIRSSIEEGESKYTYSKNTEELIKTNTYLVEYPNLKFFKLDEKYVELPFELICKVLEGSQKYFVRVLKSDPKHIEYGIVANKKDTADVIFKGNKKVLQGRLDDALFYWRNDLKGDDIKTLRAKLEKIVFHPRLGSYKDKVKRIDALVKEILQISNIKTSKEVLSKALLLVKNDKASQMIGEFATLEGIIGMYYARRAGYPSKVANLLYEHYLPTSESSEIPKTKEGVVLSLADKLDNVLSFSKIGLLPEGSNDPYEVRKNVYNILKLLHESKLDIDFYKLLGKEKKVKEFFNQRIYQIMKGDTDLDRLAKGVAYSENGNIAEKFAYFEELKALIKTKNLENEIFDTIKRVYNILEKGGLQTTKVEKKLLETNSEKELYEYVGTLKKQGVKSKDLLNMAKLLENFFEETMVNVDDTKLRKNRTSLLKDVQKILNRVLVINF